MDIDPTSDQDSSASTADQSLLTPESPTATATAITVDMEANKWSQSGEDGIIEVLLGLLKPESSAGICIDIGAHDGFFCSNTAKLREKGWMSLLIEADNTFQQSLQAIQGTHVVMARVTPENAVEVLQRAEWPAKCDVLSCDTDGDDVGIASSIVRDGFRPLIIVVEYNPTFPPFLYRMNPPGTNKGSSLKCIVDEMGNLEYDCVYATISNVILVDRRRNPGIVRAMNAFEAFRWDDVRFVCSDFDGQNYVATMSDIQETIYNPWDRLPSAKAVQYPDRLLGYNMNQRERANYYRGD